MTKSSLPTLSDAARHLVYPSTIKTSGWPRIKRRLALMDVVFDPWQEGASRLILGKDKDDRYACTVGGVVWSIPRQVGKTFTVGALVVALCIEFPALKVLWTAHRVKTATDAFRSLQGIVKRPRVRPHLAATRTDGIKAGHADQEILFANGSMIAFGAREAGFGRGFTEVDIEVFDEAQILGEKALEDMIAATNQSRHPHGALLFYLGTPPRPVDESEAFTSKRTKALSGDAKNMLYIEFSADPQSDPDDESQWPIMNPSYPHRTPRESMLRLRENLPNDDSWNREGRGIWETAEPNRVIPLEAWNEAGDEHSFPESRFALGVEVGPDLAWASVCLAGQRGDEDWHIELDEQRTGVAWLPGYLERLLRDNPQVRMVVGDVGGPLAALLEKRGGHWFVKGTKVRVVPLTVKELGSACSLLLSGVIAGTVRHIQQPQMAAAASVAGKRRLGDTGMWAWSRASATSDITPIQAATYALHGAQSTAASRPVRTERRRVVVFS